MTTTGQQTEAATAVTTWLSEFGDALTAGDPAGRPPCSPRTASGATSSPSPGTSRPSRAATRSPGMLERDAARVQPGGWTSPTARSPPSRRRDRGLDRVRDRGRPGSRASAAARRPVLDAADHPVRAQGLRGAAGPAPPEGRRARREPRPRRPGWSTASARRPSWASPSSRTC